MIPLRARPLSADEALSKVSASLAAAGAGIRAEALVPASPDLVRSLPGWVGAFGFLRSGETLYLWCEPRSEEGEEFPSQFILDVPSGRYFIDSLDARSGSWISRESAEGGPLVAGLPFSGGPILAQIGPRRV